ncbi:bifunctional precorrin-2 dehydrogenase/sirohydrochlorin ferrochelatase [Shewanella sp. WXL01]|uniref:precorrin-2 dehydrogenase/sirohydrochlorin ferrochelatase family protein n=1 Tax=Shewanella sp. WXL01 TaxID=2709721 RepID=UPI00143847CA|nr:bifunctional precorrin-2 dehydrogenase/sirohydrochlorin ferrochelatase [Shewanella sp. WXL01]NKF51128.1 bifunctional precorrin-2 dehydrogenase/sirohydrochlorin ferrochelatase [Shewanella sp. WXL01]
MQYFPLFVDTSKLKVLVVGAGDVASRKIDLLARSQVSILVIAPDVSNEIRQYHRQGRIELIEREVLEADINDVDLVYLATANNALNCQLSIIAAQRKIWANVVDNPEYCQFITPSIVDRGKLTIAISTSGAAPVFARTIRAKLEAMLPRSLAPLFDFVATKRQQVQQALPEGKSRRLFWERFFKLNQERFDEQTPYHFDAAFNDLSAAGELLLVNIDAPADLLPMAAMPLLQRIDTVCCDSAIPSGLNELFRRDAERSELLLKSDISARLASGERLLIIADVQVIKELVAHFPEAKHIRPGLI